MEPLIQLPKTAHITCGNCDDLIIEKHRIPGRTGLFFWLFISILNLEWGNILPQMISQGFRLDAVIQQCITDMKNPEKLRQVICLYYADSTEDENLETLCHSSRGKILAGEITKILYTFRKWSQLYDMMKFHGDHKIKIKILIQRELDIQ